MKTMYVLMSSGYDQAPEISKTNTDRTVVEKTMIKELLQYMPDCDDDDAGAADVARICKKLEGLLKTGLKSGLKGKTFKESFNTDSYDSGWVSINENEASYSEDGKVENHAMWRISKLTGLNISSPDAKKGKTHTLRVFIRNGCLEEIQSSVKNDPINVEVYDYCDDNDQDEEKYEEIMDDEEMYPLEYYSGEDELCADDDEDYDDYDDDNDDDEDYDE